MISPYVYLGFGLLISAAATLAAAGWAGRLERWTAHRNLRRALLALTLAAFAALGAGSLLSALPSTDKTACTAIALGCLAFGLTATQQLDDSPGRSPRGDANREVDNNNRHTHDRSDTVGGH